MKEMAMSYLSAVEELFSLMAISIAWELRCFLSEIFFSLVARSFHEPTRCQAPHSPCNKDATTLCSLHHTDPPNGSKQPRQEIDAVSELVEVAR